MKKNYYNEISVHCGNVADNFDKLKRLCEKEAEKLAATLEFPNGYKVIRVPFWTSDIPELIGVGIFKQDEKGLITYELSYSESTL